MPRARTTQPERLFEKSDKPRNDDAERTARNDSWQA
jgi:hypothetical protein